MNEQDENKLIAERKSKLASLRKEGNPFVNDFKPKDLAQNLHEEFDDATNGVLEQSHNEVSLAGRIMLKRVMGKASFVQLQDSSGQIQLFVPQRLYLPEIAFPLCRSVGGPSGPAFGRGDNLRDVQKHKVL